MRTKTVPFLILFFLLTFQSFGQILISGIVDGPLSGGVPKAIEFYVYEDISDLSIYGFGSANNGGGSDGQEFTFPSISVTTGTYLYLASETNGFNDFFGFNPDFTSGAASVNGDDAVELFKNGSVIDVFGDINVDGTGEAWEYTDGWAYRVNDSGPDGSTFNLTNWTFSGPNALDGETSNSTASTPFPIGTYTKGGSTTAPDAPVATSATGITYNSFTANWNSSAGATSYQIDVSEQSDFSSFLTGFEDLDVGNVTSYEISGLVDETEYFYRVRASNSEGSSPSSNVINVTTASIPSTVVNFKNSSGSVLETAGNYNIYISIQNPDALNSTSVDVVLISGDAADLGNYITQTITFPAGSSDDQIVNISITDDGITEGNEIFTFELQNISGGNSATIGAVDQFDLTVIESAGGNYYDGLNPNYSTFIDDLKSRIRNPYTHVAYSQYDETNIANFASIDNGDGTKSVFCVYSNYEYVYSGTFVWDVLSREHTFPHSWMPSNPADEPIERDEYSDQHHLFPTHQDNANAVRSNYAFGEVVTPDPTNGIFLEARFGTDATGNTVYEPRDEHKGDAARALLYMLVRYDGIDGYDWSLDAINASTGRDQDLDLLISWHEQDPPDLREIERNDYIQSIQGNRNPFVDHPEYVNYIDFNTMEYKSQDIYFSEYVEGSSSNKAIEIYNNTGSSIDLSLLNYKIEIYSNGSSSVSSSFNLSGTLLDGDVFVVSNNNADQAILDVSDQITGSLNFNGDDAVALVKGTEVIDVIGQIGFDPGSEWGTGDVSTQNNTIRRKTNIASGDNNGSDAFDPSIEWNGYPEDTFSGLGTHSINTGPPTITNITRSPLVPLASENTSVSADVSDDASVSLVKLLYTINGGAQQELIMSLQSGSTYSGTIQNTEYTDGDLLEYQIYSEDEDGASSTSTINKVFIGTTPITNIKSVDSDGRLIHLGTYARITGTATVESGIFSTTSLDVYIQDATAGINIYKGGSTTTIIRGNSYTVVGKIDQYNGKSELVPDNLTTDIVDNGAGSLPKPILLKANALPDPFVNTISFFLDDPEKYEGMLVGIQHLSNTNNGDVWPAGGDNANIEITDDGGTNTLTLRIDKDTDIDGSTEPSWPKDIVGIFTQFDVAAPFTWGYQIQPRDLNDIQEDGALPVELTTFSATVNEGVVNLKWETATEINNYGFEVERRTVSDKSTKSEWIKLGFIQGYGNSNSPKNYTFRDELKNLNGKYEYRLKQIDIDGKYEYSQIIEVALNIPLEFELSQNYPNPFNPTTTINFSIPQSTEVSLEVFNILGQKVATIINEFLEAGKYSYTFDAKDVTSGTYFYRISAGNNILIKKMIILK